MAQSPPRPSQSPSSARRWLFGWPASAVVAAAALLIFVIQNTEDVTFRFVILTFTWPMWLYTVVMAVFGAVVWMGVGVLRRHRRRKERRAQRD